MCSPKGCWRVATTLLVACGSAVILSAVSFAKPVRPALRETDIKALAQLGLQWAIDGGITDFKLAKEPDKLIVSSLNVPQKIQLQVPGRTVVIMSGLRIQARADVFGDFLYFEFGPFTRKGTRAEVPLALRWAVGLNSTTQYLSGGGATLEFEKKKGKWHLIPVMHRWMS